MVVKLSVEDDSLEKVYHNMMLSGERFLKKGGERGRDQVSKSRSGFYTEFSAEFPHKA